MPIRLYEGWPSKGGTRPREPQFEDTAAELRFGLNGPKPRNDPGCRSGSSQRQPGANALYSRLRREHISLLLAACLMGFAPEDRSEREFQNPLYDRHLRAPQ